MAKHAIKSLFSRRFTAILAIFSMAVSSQTLISFSATAAEVDSANSAIDSYGSFDGTNALLKANDSQVIPATGDFTAEAWVTNSRSNSTGHFNIIAQTERTDSSPTIGYKQFIIQAYNGVLTVFVGSTAYDTGWVLAQDIWTHVAATVARSGSNLVINVYVDGHLAFTKTAPATSADPSGTYTPGNDFWVGSNPVAPSGEFWQGAIDQVKIWSDDLTEAQIAESMHAYQTAGVTSAPAIAAHYDFNEFGADTEDVYNRAGNGLDLDLGAASLLRVDAKLTLTGGNIDSNRTVAYKFIRTYLTAQGGWSVPSNLTSVETLVVGAGGGGGENVGSGGSGGSIAYHSGFTLTSGEVMQVKVGAGGAPGVYVDDSMSGTTSTTWYQDAAGTTNTTIASTRRDGGNGQPSIFTVAGKTLSAPGGNGGQTYWTNNVCSGAGRVVADTPAATAGTGGTINASGGIGSRGVLNVGDGSGTPGTGWNSAANVIAGSAYKYGGGGAGATGGTVSGGADGGAAAHGTTYTRANNGAANSGGGGAGGNTGCTPGGAGGSGVVIVRSSAVSIADVTGPGSSVRNLDATISAPAGDYVAVVTSSKGTITAGALNGTTNVTAANVPSGWSGYLALRGTPGQLAAALDAATLTLPSSIGSSTLKIELNPAVTPPSGTFFNQANGHYYKIVTPGSTLNYASAVTAATATGSNYLGLNGYLANITSAAEQAFQSTNINYSSHPTIWIGARERAGAGNNGVWVWGDGPEADTQFLVGNVNGSPAKAAVAGQYNNFNSGEPNSNSGTTAGDDCGVGNFNNSDTWDDVACTALISKYLVEFGGRTSDPGVDTATITTTLQTVNVNFTELNFDFSSITKLKRLTTSGTSASTGITTTTTTDGKTLGDRIIFKNVTTRNGVIVDAVVTTKALVSATIQNYESGTGAGGSNSYFQADVDISAANGYAEFKFDFFERDASLEANCNAAIACTGSAKVILENVNVSAIDIDYYQWNDLTGLDSYTLANNTQLKECVIPGSGTCASRVAATSFPTGMRFQGSSSYARTNDPVDMAIANYGSIETFSIKFGRSASGNPNYYGVAFKALSWGSTTPQTTGAAAAQYDITYNSNGAGSGSVPSSHSGAVGAQFTTSGNTGTLAKTGYTFGGWNTAANGSGTTYLAASTVLMPNGGMTLYAIWTPSAFTLTYNANGGTGAPANETRNAGAVANLSATAPTKAGSVFGGWNTLANGTGTNYSSSASYTMPGSNTTLYAKWTSATGTIAYDGNTSTSGSAPTGGNGTTGANYTVLGNTGSLAKTNYTFAGWNTAADGTGTDYAAGAVITYPANGTTTTLYAQWTPVLYSLSYNANGGTGTVPSQSSIAGATVTLASSSYNPSRTGYTFAGWNTLADGTGTNKNAGATMTMPGANTVLYAKWTPLTYTVTYNANGGTGTQADATGTYNNAATVTVAALGANSGTIAFTGKRFVGWNTAANGSGIDYIAGSTFTISSANVVLYAKWVDASVKLTFDANGGSLNGVPSLRTEISGTTITISGTLPVRDGYTFTGWTEAQNGTGTNNLAGGSYVVPQNDTVLYAQWTRNSYTFYYNANGGTSAPSSYNGLYIGYVYTLDANLPVRSGYTFISWNSNMAGSGISYSPSGSYTSTASDVTVWAQWQGNPFTLTYNSNGGTTLSPATDTRAAGSVSAITGTAPTRTGFTFSGWNTAMNGSGTTYASSASLTMPASNLTLYAQWTAINSGVSYNANGGSGAPASANYNYGDTVTVSSTVPTRTGYTFTGWNTQQNGGGTPYSAADTFSMPNSAVVLWAQWTATSYTLDYDANGGSSAPGLANYAFAATATVSSSLPTRTGYDFLGWNTTQPGNGTARAAGATFSMPANNVTLYAQWSLATYTVYYNANGGTGSIAPQPGRYNTTITLSNTIPTRPGYTFGGWNTGADGSGVDYTRGGSLTIPGNNVTLYAKWTANTYTLTYDANGGTNAPAAETGKTVAQQFSLSASAPNRSGYWFNGWTTQADGGGSSYASSATYTMGAADVTLYARWVLNTYTLSYNANGGTGAPSDSQTDGSGNVTISGTTPTRPGYTFARWNTAPGGGGTDKSGSFNPGGNLVVYAIWTANTITITYDINTGTGTTPASQSGTYGTSIQLAGSGGFSKTSSTFLSWNTIADGSGTSYAAELANFALPSSDITLYAIWSTAYVALEYNPAGGSGAPADQFAAPGSNVNVAPSAPTKSGYDFTSWTDAATGNTYSAGSSLTMPSQNVTLVANWVVKSASVGGSPVVAEPGDILTLPMKMKQTVYFKGDRSYLTAETKKLLKALATKAKKYGYAADITIYGRVKETNDKSYDLKLSKARATNVANYLKKLGVTGKFKIIAAGISPENKPISRRVDMTLNWPKK
jgi:uncharacterized repeat protein (TIGR02543 family)